MLTARHSPGLQYWELVGRQTHWKQGVESIPAPLARCHHWKGSGTDMYTCPWYIWSSSVSTHRTGRYNQNTACRVVERENRSTFFRRCLHLRQPPLGFLVCFPKSETGRLQVQERRIVSHIVGATRFRESRNRHKGESGRINQVVSEPVLHVCRKTLRCNYRIASRDPYSLRLGMPQPHE